MNAPTPDPTPDLTPDPVSADPGNTDPVELAAALDEDDDVFERLAALDPDPSHDSLPDDDPAA